jgi:hypothetical protein
MKGKCIMPSHKSLFLARYLNLLVPGLGLIYVGKLTKGMIWILIGIPIIILEIIIIKMIISLYSTGAQHYLIFRQSPTYTAMVIAIGYYLCYRFSAKDAVDDAMDYNLRQKELEELKQ